MGSVEPSVPDPSRPVVLRCTMVGVIDVATDEIETAAQLAAPIADALNHMPVDRLIPATSCGMVALSRETARWKLSALGEGVALARRALTA